MEYNEAKEYRYACKKCMSTFIVVYKLDVCPHCSKDSLELIRVRILSRQDNQ